MSYSLYIEGIRTECHAAIADPTKTPADKVAPLKTLDDLEKGNIK